ncbi:MAG TPA: T9SS type A sorting domain-containing protein, partial [Flavitalea sp.]|nr:T9SS type A sorting domain-containing protein [Flavitalea sp.]
LAPLETLTEQFDKLLELTPGNYSVEVFSGPVNGLEDQRAENDTMKFTMTVFSEPLIKLQEGFEKTFPPDNWHLAASSRGYTWQSTRDAGRNSAASLLVRNSTFNSNGLPENLFTPMLKYNGVDSTILIFDHAYRKASRSSKEDTLEIMVTSDCGMSFESVYKKWGNDLNSIPTDNPDPLYPPGDTTGFVPLNSQWSSNYINLSKFIKPGTSFQLVFRSTSNEGSNLYLDNINVYGVNLPRFLRQNGYQVYPNPFTGSITIRHYQRASLLREVIVMNALGQRLFHRKFSGDAPDNFSIDLAGYPSGVYQVQLLYTDKKITERIIKVK